MPHAETAASVLSAYAVEPALGLSTAEARRRLGLGVNTLRAVERVSAWRIFVDQLRSLIVALLFVASALSYLFGDIVEAAAILLVIVLNAAIGFFTELRGVRSMEALRRIVARTAKVRREGGLHAIPASELVLGDLVVLEAGDVVTADMRLIECADLHADESALTGESVPSAKSLAPLPTRQPLGDRFNMVWKGTAITSGSGLGVVTAVGMGTELGRITALVDEAKNETTPLEQRLERLSRQLIWLTLLLIVLIGVAGVIYGADPLLMVEMAVALAVASFPEGLPMVTTVALARGMWRLARRNVLIERLSAVETLGATTLVCADKTGTLTENRMTVVAYALADGEVTVSPRDERPFRRAGEVVDPNQDPLLSRALWIGALCGNAELDPDHPEDEGVGDPMELALLRVARRAGRARPDLLRLHAERREEAFTAASRMMATFHEHAGALSILVKGAPESVLSACAFVEAREGRRPLTEAERRAWVERSEAMAAQGLRVLALAWRGGAEEREAPYRELTFVGLVGLLDPPRADAKHAIAGFREAGIRVAMITGDHAATARAIAAELGLAGEAAPRVVEGRELAEAGARAGEAQVYARVTPEQKLALVELHQRRGEVVAMTGDGVNDAPALEKANIGVAMGLRGTEVAKEAADVVLRDDRLASILEAVRQGRVIFGNIRRFVLYLLSCNLSEIMVVGVSTLVGLPLPLLPLQILFLNLVTDVFPALALGVGEGDLGVMRRPPRDPREDFLTRRHWVLIAVHASIIAMSTLSAMAVAELYFGLEPAEATTVSFLTLALAQTWHVLNLRAVGAPFWRNDVLSNRYVWAACITCVALVLLGLYLPISARVMNLHPPELPVWGLILGGSVLPLFVARPAATLALSLLRAAGRAGRRAAT